ncbi:hypothetical protein Glove_428g28 [Diversispora epigaea]|uniref:HMG box domain-containing protein n=1 Tax=Diversispora epigaea TaxID=1348612 RepID=A0A397GZ45_9GLOM|nr:hypothetical protein Glove_428g28 [Diversispora epigaea]
MPPTQTKKKLVIKENNLNNFGNKNCSNRNSPKSSSVEDENIKIEVDNFVSQVNLEEFWIWCQENPDSPILPNGSGEKTNIPRVSNSFFQFKRFVARYTKDRKIIGHNNQTVLSKSQSVLWKTISNEQKQFFNNLYQEALKFQKENYPDYAFHPKRQKSELKIKSMGKKSKVTVVENEYEQKCDLVNLGADHISEEANMPSITLPDTTESFEFVNVDTTVFLGNEIQNISVPISTIPRISVDFFVPIENPSFTYEAQSPFPYEETSPFPYEETSPFPFNDVSSPSTISSVTSTISTPVFSSSPQPNCNYFHSPPMDENQDNALCLNIPVHDVSFFSNIIQPETQQISFSDFSDFQMLYSLME